MQILQFKCKHLNVLVFESLWWNLMVVDINLIRSSFRIHFPSNGVLQVLDPPQGNLELVLDSQGLRLGDLQLLLEVGFLV